MMKIFSVVIITTFAICSSAFAQGVDVAYTHNNTNLSGYAVKAKGGKQNAPGVLVLPAWMGVDGHSKSSAEELGELGYHAFVADIYGVDNNPKNSKEAGQLAGKYKTDYKLYQQRIRAALEQLIKQGADPKRIAVIGYCFGGTGALEAARGGLPVVGVVSFHGGLGRDSARTTNALSAKVLVLHGADDFFVSEKEIDLFKKEMNNAKADWQMIYYADAVHAFTEKSAGNDKSSGVAYNEIAAKRSWEHMKLFFKEILSE